MSTIIGWIVLLAQIAGVIAALVSSVLSKSSWAFAMVATLVGTMWVTSATFGIGAWLIVKVISSIFPIPEWATDALLHGDFLAKIGAKRIIFIIGIVEAVMMFPFNLVMLWILNFIILQISIFIECNKFDQSTMQTAFWSAMAGSLAGSIVGLVWGILAAIPVIIGPILTLIETLPYKFTMGIIHIPTILIILHNIGFGAIGNAIAISVGCGGKKDEPQSSPSPALEAFKDGCGSHSHSHSHASYGPYDRCKCMCCPVCNKL